MVTGLRSAVSQESRTSPSVKTRRGLVLGSERPFGPWQTGTSAAPFMRSTGTSTFRDVSAEDSTITSFRNDGAAEGLAQDSDPAKSPNAALECCATATSPRHHLSVPLFLKPLCVSVLLCLSLCLEMNHPTDSLRSSARTPGISGTQQAEAYATIKPLRLCSAFTLFSLC